MVVQDKTFLGFGFGAIQGGLCLYEAYRSGNFKRLVVAEVVADLVEAVRKQDGSYNINIAVPDRVEQHRIEGIEIYNPLDPADHEILEQTVAEAQEIATALPSVNFYDRGETSVAGILASGLERKRQDASLPAAVVYTCENHNHAAEILEKNVQAKLCSPPERVQYLNTVIGKMSGVVTDAAQIRNDKLAPMVNGAERAFLVEAFNHILISRIMLPGFKRGIEVFEEKSDLMPFEEAKLYGHNATHALIGYLAHRRGCDFMADVANDHEIMELARQAFLQESGRSLITCYSGVDPLFSDKGYQAYADDLLERMMNPWLRDRVARVIRDPRRKLSWNDRLVGVMRVALNAGIQPMRYARGAAAALDVLLKETGVSREQLLLDLWPEEPANSERRREITNLILTAME